MINLSKIRLKSSRKVVLLTLFVAVTSAATYGLSHPVTVFAVDGSCTASQLASTKTTYSTTVGSGNITQHTTGYYGVAASGRDTAPDCLKYGESGNDSGNVNFQRSGTTLKYLSEDTCTNVLGGAGAVDTITLSKLPANGAGTISGSLQLTTGSGGKADPCRNTGSAKGISVSITDSTTTSTCSTTTYSMAYSGTTIMEQGCSDGTISSRTYIGDGKSLVYSILTNAGTKCGDGYNASITLKSKPTSVSTSVNGSLQTLRNQGKGVCVSSGSAKTVKVSVTSYDTGGLGSYASIGLLYAQRTCDDSGVSSQGTTAYNQCVTGKITDFEGFITACQAKDPDDAAVETCLEAKAPVVKKELAASQTESDTKTSCVIDGVGWLVCSAANFIASVTDGIYGLIENFLRVNPINTNTADGTNGTYNTWVIIRNFANVAFVLAFLVIIFSQLTSFGVSNYGIKKTLPRLIVVVILVNVSYWIGAIAVDISNILGSGLYDLLSSVKKSMNIGLDQGSNWVNIISALLGGSGILLSAGGITAGAAIVASSVPGAGLALLYLAIPLLLVAVLAVFTVIFILVARQALVIILIIVAPLAFVALLLPNTEKLFTKWRQYLMSLLLMYPIISLIFGGAQIAGLSILSTAGNQTDNSVGAVTATGLAILTGQIVMVAPFFFLPFILTKFSGGNLDSIAAKITSRGKKLVGGVSNSARKEGLARFGRGYNQAKYGDNQPILNRNGNPSRLRNGGRALLRSGGTMYDQYRTRLSKQDESLDRLKKRSARERLINDPNYATIAAAGDADEGRAMADQARAAAEAEALKEALQPLARELAGLAPADRDGRLRDIATDGPGRPAGAPARTPAEINAALYELASRGRDGVLRDLDRQFQASGTPEDLTRRQHLQEAVSANSSSLVGKAPDLVKGAAAAFNNTKPEDILKFSPATAIAYKEHIENLQTSGSANYPTAVNAFNNAMTTIQSDPTLRGSFGLDIGRALAGGPTNATITADLAPGLSVINVDGSIV